MSLTIDDETVRLPEQLAALLRVDKIEAIRVVLVNELRIYEVSHGNEADPPPPGEGVAARPEVDTGSARP